MNALGSYVYARLDDLDRRVRYLEGEVSVSVVPALGARVSYNSTYGGVFTGTVIPTPAGKDDRGGCGPWVWVFRDDTRKPYGAYARNLVRL